MIENRAGVYVGVLEANEGVARKMYAEIRPYVARMCFPRNWKTTRYFATFTRHVLSLYREAIYPFLRQTLDFVDF